MQAWRLSRRGEEDEGRFRNLLRGSWSKNLSSKKEGGRGKEVGSSMMHQWVQ